MSAFGTNGEGDDGFSFPFFIVKCKPVLFLGDNWKVICEPNKHKDDIWRRGVPIMLQVYHWVILLRIYPLVLSMLKQVVIFLVI